MRLLPGDPQRLGGYWLAGRLGAGGQGVVYDAYDEQGLRYAVKVLHGGVPEQLAKEARAARLVASFCTARVVEVCLEAAQPYIVSEFVEGPSLRQAVERHGPYHGDALHRLAAALATALAAVHRAGVVHRDLKPENVLLGPDGPCVIDFGVARSGQTSSTGFLGGTPAYMAPEVFTGNRAGPPADVFAWGGVILYAATGQDPFHAESLGGVMHRVLTLDPDLSPLEQPLRDLVARALAKDPADRPQAHELLLNLLGSPEPRERAEVALRPPPGLAAPRPLGEVAEELYASLPPRQQEALPELLLRMAEDGSVRPMPLAETEDAELVDRLVAAGLLVRRSVAVEPVETETGRLVAVGGDTVAPASAALYHAWPRLRTWLRDDRAGLETHRRLRAAARHWHERGRRRADLLHGSALEETLTWAATGRRHLAPNRLEREFLAACSAASRRRGRVRALVTAGMAAMLAVSVAAGVTVMRQRDQLGTQLAAANARAVAARAESVRASDPRAAMRLSVAAWKLSPVFEARAALQRSLAQPELAVVADPHADTAAHYRLSSRGDALIKWAGEEVTLFDARTGERTARHTLPPDLAEPSELSPDGRRAAGVRAGRTVVFDLAGGRQAGAALPAGDGVTLFDAPGWAAIHRSGRTVLHSLGDGAAVLEAGDRQLTVSGDGRWAALADHSGRVELWDLRSRTRTYTGRVDPPVTEDAGAPPAAFSADGRLLAIVGSRGTTLVDTATGRAEGDILRATAPHPPVFSRDGRFLAVEGRDGVDLWRLADRHILATYPTRRATGDYAFSPDGRRLLYLTGDGGVVSLDVSAAVDRPDPVAPVLDSSVAALSADGRVAAAETGAAIQLTDAEERRPLGTIEARGAPAFDAHGAVMAIAGDPVTVWRVDTRSRIAALDAGGDRQAIALSPDGRLLAAAGPADVQVWDVRAGRLLRSVAGLTGLVLAFSPDGGTLAVGADLVDLASGRITRDPADVRRLTPTSVAFSPDGRSVAYGLESGRVRLWDLTSGRAAGTVVIGDGQVGALRYSPDGRLLAVDGQWVSLWEVASLREVGRVPIGQYSRELAFSPDGRRLRGVLADGAVQEAPVDPALAVEAVCARAGGAFGEAEWREWIPEAGYLPGQCG
ncbi:protein kinase domain-containing protein [Thermoactinospora rubra]|uniref:protein kinase domain-containing protein n=1 Tax=Thermoactinospora rubra TaxID=1088767 RepID=UPI000A113776|nr:protein kinase [Thermoactinospora rubra]